MEASHDNGSGLLEVGSILNFTWKWFVEFLWLDILVEKAKQSTDYYSQQIIIPVLIAPED